MTRRIGGNRRKTRDKLRKHVREKSKLQLSRYLQHFQEGQRVLLKLDSSFHKGMFFPRFHGKTGTISKKRGSCYTVIIMDGNKQKHLIVHPAHLWIQHHDRN